MKKPLVNTIQRNGATYVDERDLRRLLNEMKTGNRPELARDCDMMVAVGHDMKQPRHAIWAILIGSFLAHAIGVDPAELPHQQ